MIVATRSTPLPLRSWPGRAIRQGFAAYRPHADGSPTRTVHGIEPCQPPHRSHRARPRRHAAGARRDDQRPQPPGHRGRPGRRHPGRPGHRPRRRHPDPGLQGARAQPAGHLLPRRADQGLRGQQDARARPGAAPVRQADDRVRRSAGPGDRGLPRRGVPPARGLARSTWTTCAARAGARRPRSARSCTPARRPSSASWARSRWRACSASSATCRWPSATRPGRTSSSARCSTARPARRTRWPSCAPISASPAERVLAIGDSRNDVPMLRWAGIGVAMGNALPEVRESVRYVTAVQRPRRRGAARSSASAPAGRRRRRA